MAKLTQVTEAGRLGAVEAYMRARVVPEPGKQLTSSAVFEDYRRWCVLEGLAPYREAPFLATFEAIARQVGIPLRQRGGNLSFLDVAMNNVPENSFATQGNS